APIASRSSRRSTGNCASLLRPKPFIGGRSFTCDSISVFCYWEQPDARRLLRGRVLHLHRHAIPRRLTSGAGLHRHPTPTPFRARTFPFPHGRRSSATSIF